MTPADNALLGPDLEERAAIPALLARYSENLAFSAKCKVTRQRSDSGNAERMLDGFGGQLLFDATRHAWRWWDGSRWSVDMTGVARCCARAVVRSIPSEAQNVADEGERHQVLKHGIRSDSAPRIDAMLKEAASLPGFATTSDVFDCDPWAFNVSNGTIDLRTGEMRPHRASERITRLSAIEFDPNAACPVFLRALSEMMLGRMELVQFWQRFVGYCLSGVTREQVFVVAYGAGSNGKSTLLNAVAGILGDYTTTTAAETFVARNRPAIPNDVAALSRVRLVRCAESEAGAPLAESMVKSVTGGEPLSARFLHSEFFNFTPEFKLILSTNHRPRIKGTDLAIWRRILLVPFEATFDGATRDDSLPEKLAAETPGILAWAVRGAIEWQRNGLQIPELVRAATAAYRHDEDRLADFLDEHCAVGAGGLARGGELYATFKAWAEEAGERPMSGKAFGLALQERSFTRERTRAGAIWKGLALKESAP